MQSLFLLDYFRGTDSTGLAAVRNNGDIHIAKLASDPITLFQMTKFKQALNGNLSKLFLGHNRASTSGETNNFNAHPFEFGHIVGVQNGTLEMRDKAALEEKLGEKFNVDSQALFASIAKFGIKETIEMLHEGVDYHRGAWALVWYDKNEDTVNFLRNKHRPLWLGWDKGFKRLFFASRWEFMDHAGAMADPKYEFERYERANEPGSFYRFFSLPENTHIKFNLDEMKKGSATRPKPTAKVIRGKEPVASSSKAPWDPFPQYKNHQANRSTGSTTTSLGHGSDRQGNGILHLFSKDEKLPYSHALGQTRFSYLVQTNQNGTMAGCSYCYKDIHYGDNGITVYEEQDCILCAECSGNDEKDTNIPAARIYVNPQHFAELKKAA